MSETTQSGASASGRLAVPRYESPLLERELGALTPEEQALVRSYRERGYVVVDAGIEDFDALAQRVIEDLAPRYPAVDRRVDEAWYFSPAVRQIASAPKLLHLLRVLYGREPFPFQTLNFDVGTQQAAHSDTIHFHCVPRRFMAGGWVALEDTDEGNGALFVHPGSHVLPDFDMLDLGLPASKTAYDAYERRAREILEESGFPREEVHVKKGQAILWAASLFHGGSPVRQRGRTRHSQVTHYYFDDCLYYYPMGSEPFAWKVVLREAIDIATGRMVPPRYAGRPVQLDRYPTVWTYPRPLPEWAQGLPDVEEEEVDDPGALRTRVRLLEETVKELKGELADVRDDNAKKQRYIDLRNEELAYKLARKITKTARLFRGPDAQ